MLRLVCAGALFLSTIVQGGAVEDVTVDRAVDAYSFLFPLLLAEQTRKDGQGAENTITNIPIFVPASVHETVRPNEDTLYSIAWLNLTAGPLVLSVPDTGGRYYVLQMMSLWTSTFADPGKRTTGTAAQQFAIVGPRWKGTLPTEFAPANRHFVSPTESVWMIGRTQTNGAADYPAVHAIQKGYDLKPLADFISNASQENSLTSYEANNMQPLTTEAANTLIRPEQIKIGNRVSTPQAIVEAMSAEEFFTNAAEIMIGNPPTR